MNESIKHDIVASLMCNGKRYWPGDQLEAGSPVEASFWPIHPTIDRLLQYKYLAMPFTDHSWDSSGVCIVPDVGCKGHHAYDLTTFEANIINDVGNSTELRYLTNQEIRDSVRPGSSYRMPYLYEHFEWKHCDDEGYIFKQLWRWCSYIAKFTFHLRSRPDLIQNLILWVWHKEFRVD